jgi:molybdenum cofactor cytidylyltransferase
MHGLVLAAGLGRRFGGAKLSRRWGEGHLLDGALDAALASPVDLVFVTVGADPKVAQIARARVPADRLRLVRVRDFADGLSASLRAGVTALPSDAEGVLVFLGDMPRVPVGLLAPLVAAIGSGAAAAAPFHQGRRGHPVAFGRQLFAELTSLAGDRGAGGVLDRLGAELVRIETDDDGVLFDVDRPADRCDATVTKQG